MSTFTAKVRGCKSSLQVTIPPAIIEQYDINISDLLIIDVVKIIKK